MNRFENQRETAYCAIGSVKKKLLPSPTLLSTQNRADTTCHPSYKGACLDPKASDYDCKGGSGNGPKYSGKVRVVRRPCKFPASLARLLPE